MSYVYKSVKLVRATLGQLELTRQLRVDYINSFENINAFGANRNKSKDEGFQRRKDNKLLLHSARGQVYSIKTPGITRTVDALNPVPAVGDHFTMVPMSSPIIAR